MEAKLVVVGGKANMGEVKLRLPMTIGRGRKADLIISHPTVSRIHCELTEVDGALVVRDNGSSNGTFIDDVQVQQSIVEPGQVLKIGPLSFRADYKWSGSKPELTTRENPALAATATMTYEELMGDDASAATKPPKKPDVKAKPAAKVEAKKPEVAKGKPAPAAPKKPAPPPAPEPAVNKGGAATVDDDEFDFGKDIEFVDDAPVEESVTQQTPKKAPAVPPQSKAPAEKAPAPKPAAAETVAEGADTAGREANFDFLDELGLDSPAATAPTIEDRGEDPLAEKPAPAPAPKTEDAEFDFLADLDAPGATPGSATAATVDESSGLIEPAAETFRRPTPTETVDYEFLRGLNESDDDSAAPAAEMPAVEDEPAAEEPPVSELPNDDDIDLDHFLAEDLTVEPKAEAAAVEPAAPEVDEIAEAPAAEATSEAAMPEAPSFPVAEQPQEVEDVGFDFLADDFLADRESEPAPAVEEAPPVAAASEPASEAPAADESMFDEFLADEPQVAADAAPSAEVASPEPAAPAEDAWSFDVEPEPAAEVAPTFAPPPEAAAPTPEPVAESQSTDDDGFDFLADISPTATEPAPEAEAAPQFDVVATSDAIDATVDFRAGSVDEPAETPAFSFAPEDSGPTASPPVESPFAVDKPSPALTESISSEPTVAPVAAAARAPAAKKPSFLDKLKMLFAGSKQKKAAPAKAKGPAPKVAAEPTMPAEEAAVSPFAVAPISPLSDAPIPLSDEPIKLSDEPLNFGADVAAPTAEAAAPAAAGDFDFNEFLGDATAEAPSAETPQVEPPTLEEPQAAATEEPELFDFLADVPAEPVAEAPAAAPLIDDIPLADIPLAEAPAFDVPHSEIPLADEPVAEAAPSEPSAPAAPAWASEPGIPLDDFVAEAPAAEPMVTAEPSSAPEAAAPAEITDDDFASFLENTAPAAAEAPQTAPEPQAETWPQAEIGPPAETWPTAANEPSAELPALDEASDVDQAEADLAHEIFGFEPEPAAATPSDVPVAEAPKSADDAFDAFLSESDSLDSPIPTATTPEPAAESNDDAFSFAAETEAAAAPGVDVGEDIESFGVEAEPIRAEAAPTASPAVDAPPASTRIRSIDVDTRLTASHRTLARVTIRNPRIDIPHMEPDVPAGRTFNRTGRRSDAAETTSPVAPTSAPAPEATMEAPAAFAAAAMSFGEMTAEPPPVAPPDNLDEAPQEFGFFDDEPAAATVESPVVESPAPESTDDEFNFFDDAAAESPAAMEVQETSAAMPDAQVADEFSFLAGDESAAPQAETTAAAADAAEPEFDFNALMDEVPSPAPQQAPPPSKKSDDKELDDFLSDLGMG